MTSYDKYDVMGEAWKTLHQWNGQMDVPSRKAASHTLDLQNGQMEEALHWQLPILQRRERRSSMKWTDGCPLQKGSFPYFGSPKWTDGIGFALAASHTSGRKIFYAFLSGLSYPPSLIQVYIYIYCIHANLSEK